MTAVLLTMALIAAEVGTAVTPAPAQTPLVLEFQSGWQGPLGSGLSLVFDRGGRFSGGVGLGLERWTRASLPALGVFGRARLLHLGPIWLGATATFSRVHVEADRTYQRPPAGAYATDDVHWSWEPGYRASAALAAEFAGEQWSLRVEGGLGYLLNQPRCSFDNGAAVAYGSCEDPAFPAAYRFAVQPGRLMPSVTAAIGYRFGAAPSASPSAPLRSPRIAFALSLLSTMAPVVAGLSMIEYGHGQTQSYGVAALAAGLALGPSAGHVYTGDYARAAGLAALRALALSAGTLAVLSQVVGGDCEDGPPGSCGSSPAIQALGFALLLSAPVLAIYDIADAPAAARRANARHGIAALNVLPTVMGNGPAAGRGLALAGQF